MVRIVIADDQKLMRRGLRSLLLALPGYVLCGEAKDGVEAVTKVRQVSPDIVPLMSRQSFDFCCLRGGSSAGVSMGYSGNKDMC